MYGKVILSLALFAFVALPIAHSLKCYQCNNVQDCKNPGTVTCTPAYANDTRDALTNVYSDWKIVNSTNYSCFIGIYRAGNQTVSDVRGCIQTGTATCNSQLWNTTWTKQTCNVCTGDLCNKVPNSVGTFSSSIITMIGLMTLAKFFIH